MTKTEFEALHTSADPLILFNVWDAGSARVVADAGAKAIATGSLSLSGAQGFEDGEEIDFDCVLATVAQIVAAVDLPVSVDMETGFAKDLAGLANNAKALAAAGAVGCNLEDRLLGADALRPAEVQAERIAAVASAGLFVNARTDIFLGPLMRGEDPNTSENVVRAVKRAQEYAAAGAESFFVPGLSDPDLIGQVCKAVKLPVNVMRLDRMVPNAELAELGVARISYGPSPWQSAMAHVRAEAAAALQMA